MSSDAPIQSPWPLAAIIAAATVCFGTAISSLLFQHVSNAAPLYFFAIAVLSPFVGFLCYSSMIICAMQLKYHASNMTLPMFISSLKYCTAIGGSFAVTNILVDYGRSGSKAGVPDVSTVLALLLMKLVVPVSLALESALDRRRPTQWEVSGVLVFMVGVLVSTFIYGDKDNHNDNSHKNGGAESFTITYNIKICSLCLSSMPLALGFYMVKLTRQKLPLITGMELWAILCIPEFVISLCLAFVIQRHQGGDFYDKASKLREGIACVAFGIQPDETLDDLSDSSAHCRDAFVYWWMGLPFGLAFNLAIPVLVKLKGSTSVPLFRALALPIASLIAMTNFDQVVHTPFSWNAVFGVVFCTLGLLVFYGVLWPEQLALREYAMVRDDGMA